MLMLVIFAFSITTSLKNLRLKPKQSKPGPKFALVAGTKIFKKYPKSHLKNKKEDYLFSNLLLLS